VIGPNGADKITAIRVLPGFIRTDRDEARIFGGKAGTVSLRRRIGYLPEVAMYYPFLTAVETLRRYAKLSGIPRRRRETGIRGLVNTVGLEGRGNERLIGFSKGMLQRTGTAQAIMGEPGLLKSKPGMPVPGKPAKGSSSDSRQAQRDRLNPALELVRNR
jgi:ABC-2 type transport system ATP-binding protein